MNAIRIVCLALLATVAAAAGATESANSPKPQVWKSLAPFRILKEFNEYGEMPVQSPRRIVPGGRRCGSGITARHW